MQLLFSKNQWESDFFERAIYQVNVVEQSTSIQDIMPNSLAVARVPTNAVSHLDFLQSQGFQLVETTLCFQFILNNAGLCVYSHFTTPMMLATESDIPALQQLFGEAFTYSRFRSPYFSLQEKSHFYQQWAENAVKGVFDHVCLLKKAQGELQGAVTLRQDGNIVHIGLLAVAPEHRGKGIAQELMMMANQWARQKNCTVISVCTQLNNQSAINCYVKMGAKLQSSSYCLYKFYEC